MQFWPWLGWVCFLGLRSQMGGMDIHTGRNPVALGNPLKSGGPPSALTQGIPIQALEGYCL